mgnify:CR=1 FL=1
MQNNKKTDENKPLHVLHVFGRLNRGGAESRVMDLYRNVDRTRIQFDFMQHTTKVCDFKRKSNSWEERFITFLLFAFGIIFPIARHGNSSLRNIRRSGLCTDI